MRPRPKSQRAYEELCQTIPGGVNSPVRAWKGLETTPLVAVKGKGDTLWDADGHDYVDYCGSWGPLILGHADSEVLAAVARRAEKGLSFGVTTEVEGELARKIVKRVPSVEKVRFVSSGTEATMSAVRLARAYTGRPLIVKFTGHYHGHSDGFLVKAGSGVVGLGEESSSRGVPVEWVRHTVCLPFNDEEACRRFFQGPEATRVAAVILEPVAGNMGVVPATQTFMALLATETSRVGALLIFDEVMTGFRLSLKGAQALYPVTPDLTCFGKVVGGGMPVAAFGGRSEIMDLLAPLGEVYQAGTLSGNPLAMEAGLRTLEKLECQGVYEELEAKTAVIVEPVKAFLAEEGVEACLQSCGSMFTLFFGRRHVANFEDSQSCDGETFKRFFHFMLDNGVFLAPSRFEASFVSLAHTQEHLEKTRDLMLQFAATLCPATA